MQPDNLGKQVLSNITNGLDFSLPEINLDDPKWSLPPSLIAALQADVKPLSIESLTEKRVDGNGAMDVIMSSAGAHILAEYKANRITGADYAKAYVQVVTSAMQLGLQFVLEGEKTRWESITAQINAATASIGLETAKATYIAAKAAALTAEAQYANQVMDLALKNEQYETVRAQTMDTRVDGSPVKGSVGKQKDLYSQQITSYMRSSETNAVKILSDAFITMKSIDEGLEIPPAFQSTPISTAVNKLIANNNLN